MFDIATYSKNIRRDNTSSLVAEYNNVRYYTKNIKKYQQIQDVDTSGKVNSMDIEEATVEFQHPCIDRALAAASGGEQKAPQADPSGDGSGTATA